MNFVVSLDFIADCSSHTYLFSAHQSDTRPSCICLHMFLKTIKLCIRQPSFQQLLGIICIIHLDKRLSSKPVYKCQYYSSNQLTLPIWQLSPVSQANWKLLVWGMNRVKQSTIHSNAASCRLWLQLALGLSAIWTSQLIELIVYPYQSFLSVSENQNINNFSSNCFEVPKTARFKLRAILVLCSMKFFRTAPGTYFLG